MQLAVNNQVISEEEIQQVIALKETLKQLKKQVESISNSLSSAESTIVSKLESGATSPRDYTVNVSIVSRRFPSWKEHFLAHNGKQIADDILKNTPPKIYKNLNIKAA